jgi:hypothetical protein
MQDCAGEKNRQFRHVVSIIEVQSIRKNLAAKLVRPAFHPLARPMQRTFSWLLCHEDVWGVTDVDAK